MIVMKCESKLSNYNIARMDFIIGKFLY
jgi:hypothetical protein